MAADHSTAFTSRADLASARLGGRAIAANDEFFAPKSSLLKPDPPVFIPGKFTSRGKWMDGWESRRRRTPGHDWCVVKLGVRGRIHGVNVDTAHFTGNFPSHCSIDALDTTAPLPRGVAAREGPPWTPILPVSPLRGDADNLFAIADERPWTHLRLNIFPDGGVARLRVHGEPFVDWMKLARSGRPIDLAALRHGGLVLGASDMHFGAKDNIIMPGRAKNMGDGWETRRRRGPGHDWAVIRLGAPGRITQVEIDTTHFKGNYPESASLEGCDAPGAMLDDLGGAAWMEILARTTLRPHRRHLFPELARAGAVSHVRFNIFPDGGVSRLRVYGTILDGGEDASPSSGRLRSGRSSPLAPASRWQRIEEAGTQQARALLHACCGSSRWVDAMMRRRPFGSRDAALRTARDVWFALAPADWLEAFAGHPRIGDTHELRRRFPATHGLSTQEQAGIGSASDETLSALGDANRAYEKKFGYIFIVCASGKSAGDMLALLRTRLANDPADEIRIAAEEQARITALRLASA